MSITSRMLYNKLCGLRPDLSSRITPEILSEICDDPNTQPFLKWFFENVHFTNVLSSEEIILKNTLSDESNEWLEDEVLDAALEEATRDCPELLHLVDLDDTYKEDLFEEYEILKDCYKEDKEYLNSLKHSIINLKEVDNRLDDDIEEAETLLHKEQIETEKLYENCSVVLKEFDRDNCQFSKDVDSLLNIYANATKNQGDTVLWSQMPIDLFIKQVELYNHYLGIHIRKQFESVNKEEQDEDSDYASLINNSREKQVDERMHELISCKTNLRNSKIEEINADIQVESYIAMLQSIRDIYNSGILKVPGNNEIEANKVNKDYMAETQYEPTNSFKPISYEISTNYEEISANVQELQADVTKIRNQFKERMKADASFEREKDILWQRFLADPDTLKMKYEEAKQRVDDSHFGDTVESKPSF
ncbi:hypothetical protein EAI_03694 [Harpegnathos saltator]|uniref:HAUS augmin-like complex subunit 3 N-terminal domain-containing protein n=1 Tax=Harpegnathos saltator TaxID=610380 RepID=E2BCC5_HARSA|nr:hypothetical protein EAI_03694 [Harpegnathos saltator]